MNAVHVSLAANTPTRVRLTGKYSIVEVITRTGSTEIYFTAGSGDQVEPVDPTIGGNDTYVLPANVTSPASVRRLRFNTPNGVTLKFLTTGASEKISVLGLARGEDAATW